MKRTDPRLWFPFALAGVGCVVIIGLLLLPKLGKGRPTGSDPNPPPKANRPDLMPWMKVRSLEGGLRECAPSLRVVYTGPNAGQCWVMADGATPAWVAVSEEYADCWRGVVLCVADPPPQLPGGEHACRVGDFYLFGDLELMEKVKPVAEGVRFGPWRGVGGPAQGRSIVEFK